MQQEHAHCRVCLQKACTLSAYCSLTQSTVKCSSLLKLQPDIFQNTADPYTEACDPVKRA